MSSETERVYTINLGKVLLSPDNRRAKRAINMMRDFARHHMGIADVRIDEDVSHHIWKRGIRHPPRKIRVRLYKTDDGHVLISKYEGAPDADAKEETTTKSSNDTPSVDSKSDDKQLDDKPASADTKKDPVDDKPASADVKKDPVDDKPASADTDVKKDPVDDKPASADVKKDPVDDKPANIDVEKNSNDVQSKTTPDADTKSSDDSKSASDKKPEN